jgi:hypothetical protein
MNRSQLTSPKGLLCVPAIVLAPFLLAGCGGSDPAKTNVVEGIITIDGNPAAFDILNLHYEDGKARPIDLDEKGHFRVQGVQLGKVKVTVVPKFQVPPENLRYQAPPDMQKKIKVYEKLIQIPRPTNQGELEAYNLRMAEFGIPLPSKYGAPAQSGLTAEIRSGNNKLDFQLTSS